MFSVRDDISRRLGGASGSGAKAAPAMTAADMKRRYETELEKTIMKQEDLIINLTIDIRAFEAEIQAHIDKGDDDLAQKPYECMQTCLASLKAARDKLAELKVDRTKVEALEMQNAQLKLRSMRSDVSTAIMGAVAREDIEGLMRREADVHDAAREREDALNELDKFDAERTEDAVLASRAREAEKTTNPAAQARKTAFEEYVGKARDKKAVEAASSGLKTKTFDSEFERMRQEVLAKKNKEKEKSVV